MANQTMLKFNYPATLIREYDNWVILLRPQQVTLGSLVVACKTDNTSLGQLSSAVFSELSLVTSELETALSRVVQHEKINYLSLMMVDKNVHFHVLPRYSGTREFAKSAYSDASWPGPPDLSRTLDIPAQVQDQLQAALIDAMPSRK